MYISGPPHPPGEISMESSTSNTSFPGTDTDFQEELHTPSPSHSDSEVTSSASSSNDCRASTPSQSEIFSDYKASSEASLRETSRLLSPESGNLTAKTVYLPLPEMAILQQRQCTCPSLKWQSYSKDSVLAPP